MSRLKKNLVFYITYNTLFLFLPLIMSSYLSRILGAEGIGRYTYAYSIALYFVYFIGLGLDKYGNRMIASVQKNKELLSKTFSEIYTMQIICFGIGGGTYFLYTFFIADDKAFALIQTVFVLSSLFDITWFFFGMEMFDKAVIRNIIVKLMSTALTFMVVKTKSDVDKYALIMAASYLIHQLALWPYLFKHVDFKFAKWKEIKKHIRPNLTMFLPVIAASMCQIIDKIMLGMMTSKAQVGFYENAEKIVDSPKVVIAALGAVMFPRVTVLISEKRNQEVNCYRDAAIMIVTAFCVAACFGIIGVGDSFAFWMWGEEFAMSGRVMKYLSATLIFFGIGNVIRTQFLIPYQYDNVYVISVLLSIIVNIAVNAFLIPPMGAIGAAIGTICAEAVACLYQLFLMRKYLPLLKYARDVALFCIAGVIMLLVIILIPTISSVIGNLLIHTTVGAVVYLLLAIPLLHKEIKVLRR